MEKRRRKRRSGLVLGQGKKYTPFGGEKAVFVWLEFGREISVPLG
jgi:hypothetical protein